jgi:hypothetical protein
LDDAMQIEVGSSRGGLKVHFDAEECELFMKLAKDAAQTNYADDAVPTYFSVCLSLGRRMNTMLSDTHARKISS